jgi:putative membrane protein
VLIRWFLASIHLLALPIGLAAVWLRARALRGSLDRHGIRRVLIADTWWGVAAVLWLSTGLWRWLGGIEKVRSYYLTQPMFHAKLGLFFVILLLELWPMVTFIRWRAGLARGVEPDVAKASSLARVSEIEAALVVAIVFAATAMARGLVPWR